MLANKIFGVSTPITKAIGGRTNYEKKKLYQSFGFTLGNVIRIRHVCCL